MREGGDHDRTSHPRGDEYSEAHPDGVPSECGTVCTAASLPHGGDGVQEASCATVVVPQGSDGQGAATQPGDGASGRNTILQMPFDQMAKVKLINIGLAYRMAMASNGKPPKDAVELDAGPLKTKRDMQDHEVEVVYGVNPSRLQGDPADYMIAWEKEPTNDGYRMVMMADFATVKYVSQAEFEKMKKAK